MTRSLFWSRLLPEILISHWTTAHLVSVSVPIRSLEVRLKAELIGNPPTRPLRHPNKLVPAPLIPTIPTHAS